jgi:hypothetical protein
VRSNWSSRLGKCALLVQAALATDILLGASVVSAQISNPTLGSADRTLAVDGRTQPDSPALSPLVPSPLDPASALSSASPQASNAGQTSNAGRSADQSSADDKEKQLKVNPVTGLAEAPESGYRPLTGAERVKLYFRMNYWSAGAYFGPFFSALLLDQATGSPAQWGGGFPGYGRRVASRLGSAILQGTFQAPVAAVLHEDVRYIASSQHGFKHRAAHALAYSFLTYNNQGHPTLNVANLSAYYASTAVSTAWLPDHHSLAGYTFSNSSEQIALTLPVNLLQEFWPEVLRYAFHRH